ncbi:MAG: GtrA family protein [Chlamydiales bacterium]|nr:GtrA family protein [Chlamydiales bacterium]
MDHLTATPSSKSKMLKFSATGVVNTLIDFGITNLLIFLVRPSSLVVLGLISVIACTCGMIFSYFSNRYWTFKSHLPSTSHREVVLFFLMASFSMLVNTSTFLFFFSYLGNAWTGSEFTLINASKLAGVVAGSLVGFFTYNFLVFRSPSVARFRETFDFYQHTTSHISFWNQALWIVTIALAARVAFLFFTTAVVGDAIQYSNIAVNLAGGHFEKIDRFWVSLFCYWEALFVLLGANQLQAAILSTLVPGVLMMIPVVWIARTYYGSNVAWLAGLFCALHPRLISYSTNGYAEMFYLGLQAAGIAFLIAACRTSALVLGRNASLAVLGWGLTFGAYTATRNEGLLFFLATLIVPFTSTFALPEQKPNNSWAAWFLSIKIALIGLVAFGIALGGYVMLSEATLGTPGIFQKTDMLAKQYSEQLDYEQAAKEVYGENGISRTESTEKKPFSEVVVTLLKRLPRNMLYFLQRIPGILLSPLFLFALVLPAFAARKYLWRDHIPLLLMGLFPLFFYPLIQLEPRYLFGMLIPVHIFGAAGLWAFYVYLRDQVKTPHAYTILLLLVGSILALNIVVTAWLGIHIERDYDAHRRLAAWVQDNVAPGEVLVGDGYGYISNTGFLAKHPYLARLWTDDPQRIIDFVQEHQAHWLIMYEPFIEKGNKQLLPILDSGLPGAKKLYETKDRQGKRYQIYYVEGS